MSRARAPAPPPGAGTALADQTWIARAARVTPGGVHSPVRAFGAARIPPIAIASAKGARVRDTQGREYVDWIGAWGPSILGHAHPAVVDAVRRAAEKGLLFGLASPAEIELCERVSARVPGCESLRLVATGTEATMTAVRIARAATGRPAILKFAGCYHGHADSFLIQAGSGAATWGVPSSPGVTEGVARDTCVARYNDLDDVDRVLEAARGRIAAIVVEPVAGNMGCVPPEQGFLDGLRERCDREGALLILDEIITGLRLGPGGAGAKFGVVPDLVTLGKVLGGGMPLAAYGGRADLMSSVSPSGPVYQGGTYAAHPLAVAAGLAVLHALDADPKLYARLEARGAALEAGITAAAAEHRVPLAFQRAGSMWTPFFTARRVRSWDDADSADRSAWATFFRGMLERGVLLPPSQFECGFVSAAHGEEEVALTISAARASLAEVRA